MIYYCLRKSLRYKNQWITSRKHQQHIYWFVNVQILSLSQFVNNYYKGKKPHVFKYIHVDENWYVQLLKWTIPLSIGNVPCAPPKDKASASLGLFLLLFCCCFITASKIYSQAVIYTIHTLAINIFYNLDKILYIHVFSSNTYMHYLVKKYRVSFYINS